jgi:hypothetical protein
MVNFIVNLLGGTLKDWLADKREIGKKKAEANIETSKNSMLGWSDEYLILVWSYPFISLFIPSLREKTEGAFSQLGILPDWYIAGFLSITFAVFGIDKLFKWKGGK